MAVSVGAIAKKAIETVSSNKKGRKILLWIIGIAIAIALLPVIFLWGMFGWTGEGDAVELDREAIVDSLSEESMEEIENIITDENFCKN